MISPLSLAPALKRTRGDSRTPADAYFFERASGATILAALATRSIGTCRIHAAGMGVLVVAEAPGCAIVRGCIRLRAIAPHVLIPVDAKLVPSFLEDEARGLTRHAGLVFLPGGRVLAYDRDRPLPIARLVAARVSADRSWAPFAEPPRLAERIKEIRYDAPASVLVALEESEREGDGRNAGDPSDRDADPFDEAPKRGAGAEAVGSAEGAQGGSPSSAGGKRGGSWLGKLGQFWMRKGAELAPKLGERLFNRQGRLLARLLNEFRRGNVDRALERSIPLADRSEQRGTRIAGAGDLPRNSFKYAVQALFGKGKGAIWLGGNELWPDLISEYRKAAEAAAERGDFRRSAMIYAKLLREYHTAANMLERGGLHRDAAIVFERKCQDFEAAARAYEAGGDFDRALSLYRRTERFVLAANLLRRIGDEPGATAEYRNEAERLMKLGRHALVAGDLMRVDARRPDLAYDYYAQGFSRRDRAGSDLACGLRMIERQFSQGEAAAARGIVAECEARIAQDLREGPATAFLEGLVELADRPEMGPHRSWLRDRALIAAATALAHNIAAGRTAFPHLEQVLARPGHWPASLVNDARHAVTSEVRRRREAAASWSPATVVNATRSSTVQIAEGSVTAVVHAQSSGMIFVGFADGTVSVYDPTTRVVVPIAARSAAPILWLAVDESGDNLAVLSSSDAMGGVIRNYRRGSNTLYACIRSMHSNEFRKPLLTPILTRDSAPLLGLWDGRAFRILVSGPLSVMARIDLEGEVELPAVALLMDLPGSDEPLLGVLLCDEAGWGWVGLDGRRSEIAGMLWKPEVPEGSVLGAPIVSIRQPTIEHFEIAGLGESGAVRWNLIEHENDRLEVIAGDDRYHQSGKFQACTLVGDGRIAAIAPRVIHWLVVKSSRLVPVKFEPIAIDNAVACFPARRSNELIVVTGDGQAGAFPIPI